MKASLPHVRSLPSASSWIAAAKPVVSLTCAAIFATSLYHALTLFAGTGTSGSPLQAAKQNLALRPILEARLFNNDTHINISQLALRGTFAGSGNTPSYAIISVGDQPEKSYRVGDRVGGAKIKTIANNAIVLSNGSTEHTLRLKPSE